MGARVDSCSLHRNMKPLALNPFSLRILRHSWLTCSNMLLFSKRRKEETTSRGSHLDNADTLPLALQCKEDKVRQSDTEYRNHYGPYEQGTLAHFHARSCRRADEPWRTGPCASCTTTMVRLRVNRRFGRSVCLYGAVYHKTEEFGQIHHFYVKFPRQWTIDKSFSQTFHRFSTLTPFFGQGTDRNQR